MKERSIGTAEYIAFVAEMKSRILAARGFWGTLLVFLGY